MASSTSSETTKILKLRSRDNKVFDVEENVAIQCKIIKNMVEDDCVDGEIPLPNVVGEALEQIIEWCKKHAVGDKDLEPLESEKVGDKELKEWEANFMNVDVDILYNLLMAAHYLEIGVLVDQLCGKVATMIKGKTPEQIRQTFRIENDFSKEEEERIHQKNPWAFD